MKDLNSCSRCRYFVAVHSVCAAPQLVDLARLVGGEQVPGQSIPALFCRLNQSLCASAGYWFAENPPPAPVTKELPAAAPAAESSKPKRRKK